MLDIFHANIDTTQVFNKGVIGFKCKSSSNIARILPILANVLPIFPKYSLATRLIKFHSERGKGERISVRE